MNVEQHVVYLVRHGETDWSLSGRHTGRTDIPLTEYGRRQARHAGDVLRELRADSTRPPTVWCSPRERAVATAHLAGFDEDEQTEMLSEWDYGDYEGATSDRIRQCVDDWTIWTHPVPGGETAETVGARATLVLDKVRDLLTEQDVILFGHGHFSRVLISRWLDLPASAGSGFAMNPGGVSVLGHEHGMPQLQRLNITEGS